MTSDLYKKLLDISFEPEFSQKIEVKMEGNYEFSILNKVKKLDIAV